MAHCRRTPVQPSALTRSPRRSRGLTPCERLVSGSTPNKITSGLRASRSEFSLFRLRKRNIVFIDASNECALMDGSTPNEITSCQAASRSEFSLNRFQKGDGARGDTSNECALAAAHKKNAVRRVPRGDDGANEGNRTLDRSLGSCCFTIKLHSRSRVFALPGERRSGGNDSILAQRGKMSTLRALFLNPKKRRDSVAFRA